MSQHAANVVDFAAYRALRDRRLPVAHAIAYDVMQTGPVFALPVMLPVMIGWLPVWMAGVAISGGTADE